MLTQANLLSFDPNFTQIKIKPQSETNNVNLTLIKNNPTDYNWTQTKLGNENSQNSTIKQSNSSQNDNFNISLTPAKQINPVDLNLVQANQKLTQASQNLIQANLKQTTTINNTTSSDLTMTQIA